MTSPTQSAIGGRREAAPHARSGAARRSPAGERVPWVHFAVFLAGAVLVVLFTAHQISAERETVLTHWKSRLAVITADRARLVSSWLAARRADAEVLAAFPAVRALLGGQVRDEEALARHLSRVAAAYGYSGIVVSDGSGRPVARAAGGGEAAARLAERAAAHAVSVGKSGQPRFELSGREPDRLLVITVPIFPDGMPAMADRDVRALAGSVTLGALPETGLYPLLADEAERARTGETLLVDLAADPPAFLSPLREPISPDAEAPRRSLQALRDLGKTATTGRGAVGEIEDYRGVPTVTAVRPVGAVGWTLALKVDRDEVLAEFQRSGRLAGAVAASLLLALAGFLIALHREQQRARLLQEQVRQARAMSNLQGYADRIVASVPAGLLLLSDDLHVLSANRAFLESFRLREEDVLGRDLQQLVRAERLVRAAREVLATGETPAAALYDLYVYARRDTKPARITMSKIAMADEEPPRLLLVVEDLTEEERLQTAHQESEKRYRDLIQGLDAIVWEADARALTFSFVSGRAATVLGYPVERWLREPDFWVRRIHPDDRESVMQICRDAIAQGRDHELEYRSVAADGREVWLRDIVHVVRDSSGRPVTLRGLTVDLTELRRSERALRQSEDQLRQAQKMDAVGKLAGGIAHDFNNLLMVIRGDSDLMLRRLAPADPLRSNAEGIRDAADQAASLTRQLLAFSRKQVTAPRFVDLNAIVASIHAMLQRLLGETINLVTVAAPDLGAVKADPGQVEQMILNLCVNARDAMPDGGRLTVRTANVDLDDAAAAQWSDGRSGPYVMLEVTDTGIGMDAQTRSHLFEPFFTTKEQGKGTGLGLSTVYGTVKQSGGHISVESEPGRGSTFTVYLPRVAAVAPPAEPRPAAATGPGPRPRAEARLTPGRGETILLVEDAQRVRAVVKEILEMSGYVVLEARHGAEALEVSGRHGGTIHLLVTDVVMPQMSGRELAQRLATLRPQLKVLYMSGYTDDAIVRHGVLASGIAFLSKPFTPDALALKVREVLDGVSDGAPARAPAGPAGGARPRR
jgi:PAS domain S-box-containing protein